MKTKEKERVNVVGMYMVCVYKEREAGGNGRGEVQMRRVAFFCRKSWEEIRERGDSGGAACVIKLP